MGHQKKQKHTHTKIFLFKFSKFYFIKLLLFFFFKLIINIVTSHTLITHLSYTMAELPTRALPTGLEWYVETRK